MLPCELGAEPPRPAPDEPDEPDDPDEPDEPPEFCPHDGHTASRASIPAKHKHGRNRFMGRLHPERSDPYQCSIRLAVSNYKVIVCHCRISSATLVRRPGQTRTRNFDPQLLVLVALLRTLSVRISLPSFAPMFWMPVYPVLLPEMFFRAHLRDMLQPENDA